MNDLDRRKIAENDLNFKLYVVEKLGALEAGLAAHIHSPVDCSNCKLPGRVRMMEIVLYGILILGGGGGTIFGLLNLLTGGG